MLAFPPAAWGQPGHGLGISGCGDAGGERLLLGDLCNTQVPSGLEQVMAGPCFASTAWLPAETPRCQAGCQGSGQGTWQAAAAVAFRFFLPLPMI